jgi:hypothetical protein
VGRRGAVLCCAVVCCAVLCCAVLCCAVLCCAVLCCAVLCCAVASEWRARPTSQLAAMTARPTFALVRACAPCAVARAAHTRSCPGGDAKAFAAKMLHKNPNSYFYRHCAPHETQVGGARVWRACRAPPRVCARQVSVVAKATHTQTRPPPSSSHTRTHTHMHTRTHIMCACMIHTHTHTHRNDTGDGPLDARGARAVHGHSAAARRR